MKSFRIPSSPEAEQEIATAIKELQKNREPLKPSKSPLSRFERIRFKVLQQQFASGYMPGLPMTVGTLHRLYRVLKAGQTKH